MAETLNLGLPKDAKTTSSGTLKYPNNLFENNTDYVYFKFYKYTGPFSGIQGSTTDATGKTTKDTNPPTSSNPYNTYNATDYKADDTLPIVMLYMPEDISTGYATDWGGKGFTSTAADIMRGGGTLASGETKRTLSAVKGMIERAGKAGPTVGAETIANAINSLPAGLGGAGVNTNDILQTTAGVVLNPNTELMFNGFELRNFSLRFKLAPRSAIEAKAIRQIIGAFKAASRPNLGQMATGALQFFKEENKDSTATSPEAKAAEDTSNANYVGVPDLVHVQFRKGAEAHPFLPLWKMCALVDVSVNYTPDGVYSTYGGNDKDAAGSPVAYELTLSFIETKLIYRQDISLTTASY